MPNQKTEVVFKISIGYLALYFLLIAGIALGLACFYAQADANTRSIIAYGSSLLGAMIALCTLLYTAQNIRRSNEEKLSVAASKFMERWNAPSYFDLKTRWRVLREELEPLSPEQRSIQLSSDSSKRTTAVEILNFLEEMAVAIHTRSVDEELLKRFFRSIVIRHWDIYEYWIRQHRKKPQSERFCIELEKVVDSWRAAPPAK